MKVIFMGTPIFALKSLEILDEYYEVAAVVTQPDKPNKRGNKVEFNPVKEYAIEKGIDLYQPKTVKDNSFIDKMKQYEPDLIVVAAFGQILPNELLEIPKICSINVHGSLLPKYRGAAPIQWSIINGENSTGITIILINEKLDSGDMILKQTVVIDPEDDYGTLYEKMANQGAVTLMEAMKQIEAGVASRSMQNDAEATYAPMIKKDTGHINWNKESKDIVNLIRGLNPQPGAYAYYNNQKIKIWKADILLIEKYSDKTCRDLVKNAKRGEIVSASAKEGIIVKTDNNSAVIITELQAPNGKKMSAPDYLRGHKVNVGDAFE